jgi:iron(III) transport system substrate-binding protein
MVYTPFPQSTADEWAAAFERDTGIHVEQIEEPTTRVYSRLRAEKAYPRADVWIGGGGMVPFISAANEGLLEPYQPHIPFDMPEHRGHLVLRDPQWRWEGVAIIGLGFAYNPSRLPADQLPRTWDDLALPRWHHDVIMYDPAASGTAMLFVEAAIMRSLQHSGSEEPGWKYLTDYYHNLSRYAGDGPPSMMVSRGECDIGIHFEHQVLQYIEQNHSEAAIEQAQKSLRWTILPESPVIVDPIALVKGAPHPENARRFIDYIFSHEGMRIINKCFFVVDPSFPAPPHLDYTIDQMMAHSMPLDIDWMGANFHRLLVRWQNQVEDNHWLWEGS